LLINLADHIERSKTKFKSVENIFFLMELDDIASVHISIWNRVNEINNNNMGNGKRCDLNVVSADVR
jgi:hypothetical protein